MTKMKIINNAVEHTAYFILLKICYHKIHLLHIFFKVTGEPCVGLTGAR